MELINFAINGQEYHLLLNGTALFNCYDRLGREKTLMDHLEAGDKQGYDNMLWMLCEFAMQGELYRRWQGEDRGPILQYARAAAEVLPSQLPQLKLALAATIRNGFTRQHLCDEDSDPWLAEIEQKKTTELHGRSIFGWLRTYLGSLSKRE